MTAEREGLRERLAEIEADMDRSDPRFVSKEVREIVELSRSVLALIDTEPDARYVVVHSALEAAYDVLDEVVGCDCGTDEPGTCASCMVEEALRVLLVGPAPRVEPVDPFTAMRNIRQMCEEYGLGNISSTAALAMIVGIVDDHDPAPRPAQGDDEHE